jgi:hypothetical protein
MSNLDFSENSIVIRMTIAIRVRFPFVRNLKIVPMEDSFDIQFDLPDTMDKILGEAYCKRVHDYLMAVKHFIVNHSSCLKCKEGFSDKNCFTPSGWRETQITGYCEKCFDQMFQ